MLHITLLALSVAVHVAVAVKFQDVSIKAGMKRPYGRRLKYGGACVADLDGDGHQDLLFGHHDDRYADIYFNRGDGTFTRYPWSLWVDAHGFNAFRFYPWQKGMHFTISRGGNYGRDPHTPLMFAVQPGKHVKEVSKQSGLNQAAGSGRSAVFLQLRRSVISPDVVFTKLFDHARSGNYHRAFQASKGKSQWKFHSLHGSYANDLNTYASVTDVDGDGRVELVSFHEFRIYKNTGYFTLRDISKQVLPPLDFRGVVAVAELDYDNDGRWDLYIARTISGELNWIEGSSGNDYLLRNVGGRYVDVSKSARIPKGTMSRGVTAGDFNNDGYVDLIVTQYNKPDLLLLNKGDGTFRTRNAGFNRSPQISGDMATAVDLNRDGKLDIVLSEGDWHHKKRGGFYRIMKNISATKSMGNYILVRVKSAPGMGTTSLHAVVRVFGKKLFLMRRVGTPGTAVSNSYIELLHFGLGNRKSVNRVTVRWVNGRSQSRGNVKAGSTITFGA